MFGSIQQQDERGPTEQLHFTTISDESKERSTNTMSRELIPRQEPNTEPDAAKATWVGPLTAFLATGTRANLEPILAQ